jgi:hypothetical protein
MQKLKALWALIFLLAGALACGIFDSTDDPSLKDRMGGRISEAQEAEKKASAVWDRVLFGEPVTCAEIIDVPPVFDLTQDEAQENPQSLAIRDLLNTALLELAHAAELWAQECQLDRPVIPLDIVRQAEDALQTALDLLNQSASTWAVWQP